MLPEMLEGYALAIGRHVGPGVAVYQYRPDTAAGPCVWVELESVRWSRNMLYVALRAVVMGPDGREPAGGTAELGHLVDRVLAAAIDAGAPADGLVARPSTRLAGDVSWPVVEVTTTSVRNACDLPAPPPLTLTVTPIDQEGP